MNAAQVFRQACGLDRKPAPPQLDDAADDIAKAVQVRRVPQVGLVPVDGVHRIDITQRLDEWFKNECGVCEDEGYTVQASGLVVDVDDDGRVWLIATDVEIDEH